MKQKFMNFLEKLSRDEMRTITGGYGDGDCTSDPSCNWNECAEVNGRPVAFFTCAGGVGCVETDAWYCIV